MNTMNIIVSIVFFILAGLALVYAICASKKRGPILSNVYLFASEKQRESLNKEELYKECRNISAFIFMISLNTGASVLFEKNVFTIVALVFIIGVVVYAVVISAKSLKNEKQ